MSNLSKDILMFNMSAAFEWGQGFRNRNFFILQELVKHPRVSRIISVDFVPPTFKRRLKEWYAARLFQTDTVSIRGWNFRCEQKGKIYTYSGTSHKPLRKVLSHLGIEHPILWSYNPLVVDYLDIPRSFFIFDAVDNWSQHSVYSNVRAKLINNYATIRKSADVIFTVAPALRDVFQKHPQVHCVPNGVDAKHFTTPQITPDDLTVIPHPRIGYAGVIQDRFDVALLAQVVAKNPDWHFVLIGDIWPDAHIEPLRRYAHVYFLGRKSYDALPAYLQHIDVAMIPHKVNAFTKTMNPLKLYEYLACGKPIVSTPVAGTEMFARHVACASTPQEFQQAIAQVLLEDSVVRSQERQRAVSQHTWEHRLHKMFSIIDATLSSS